MDSVRFFPSIGSHAANEDARADVQDGIDGNADQQMEGEDEERAVQEVDSLCMRCHEQVSRESGGVL